MLDEIFDQEGDDLQLGSKDYERRQELISKDGLRDGLHEGKEKGLQKGFDEGYERIFPIFETLGYIKGIINAVIGSAPECDPKSEIENARKHFESLHENIKSFQSSVIEDMENGSYNTDEVNKRFETLKDDVLSLWKFTKSPVDKDLIISCRLPHDFMDKK